MTLPKDTSHYTHFVIPFSLKQPNMNQIGVGKSPLAPRNRLRYIPPSIHRRSDQCALDTSDAGKEADHSFDNGIQTSVTDDPNQASSHDGRLTLLSAAYSIVVIFFFRSILDRLRPNSSQTSRQPSTSNLMTLQEEAIPEEPGSPLEKEPIQTAKSEILEPKRDLPRSSNDTKQAETSDILPLDLFGPSISKNGYSSLYESMFEVESSDEETLNLCAQYGTSLGISEHSSYIPKVSAYEALNFNSESAYISQSSFANELPDSALDPLTEIDTSAYMEGARQRLFFGSTSHGVVPASNLGLESSEEYDRAVSKFYTPFKPAPAKEFSLTDVIMATIPSSSLSSFLRRQRDCIQDLIVNERKVQLSKINPLTPQQLQVVTQYWSSRLQNLAVVSAFSIDITVRDLGTLNDGRWLNDNIIDFYLNMVTEKYSQVYCWTTHFFTTLKSKGYQGVARWAKRRKVNVAEKSLVIVPINIMSTHWAVAVIDNDAATISYYDSLASKGNPNAVQLLQQYMLKECERLLIAPKEYTLHPNMETPQQLNGFDCGVFSCTVAKYISSQNALSFTQDDMKTIRRRMAFEIIQKNLLDNTSQPHL